MKKKKKKYMIKFVCIGLNKILAKHKTENNFYFFQKMWIFHNKYKKKKFFFKKNIISIIICAIQKYRPSIFSILILKLGLFISLLLVFEADFTPWRGIISNQLSVYGRVALLFKRRVVLYLIRVSSKRIVIRQLVLLLGRGIVRVLLFYCILLLIVNEFFIFDVVSFEVALCFELF